MSSCSSDKEEIITNKTEKQSEYAIKNKKELILEKIKELGLDPKRVSFTDEYINDDKIIVNSIKDLDVVFKGFSDKGNLESKTFYTTEKNPVENHAFTSTNFDKTTKNFIEYYSVYNTTPVYGALFNMNLQYNFSYSPVNLRYKDRDGYKDISSFITGFVLGVSYQQQYAQEDLYMNGPQMSELHELRIHGVMNYNLFIEDIGTIYRSPVLTGIKFRLPDSKYSNNVSFFQAFTKIL
ncbi:hypothetical protein [Myroides odoratus]|uniref:hypothetical protein n=1 Tax=Myroides odoratus TaxID=256 RepID=UPI0039AEBB0E